MAMEYSGCEFNKETPKLNTLSDQRNLYVQFFLSDVAKPIMLGVPGHNTLASLFHPYLDKRFCIGAVVVKHSTNMEMEDTACGEQ